MMDVDERPCILTEGVKRCRIRIREGLGDGYFHCILDIRGL